MFATSKIHSDSVIMIWSTVPDQASPVSKTEQIWGIWWHKGGHEVKQTRPACLKRK